MPYFLLEEYIEMDNCLLGNINRGIVVAESFEAAARKLGMGGIAPIDGKIKMGPFQLSEIEELVKLPRLMMLPVEPECEGLGRRSPEDHDRWFDEKLDRLRDRLRM